MKKIVYLYLLLYNLSAVSQENLVNIFNSQHKKLLLFGEQHHISESDELFKKTVQNFSKQFKINILFENPLALQPFIDEYMKTGDSTVFSDIKSIFNCNDSFCLNTTYIFNRYKYLYELNKKLPVSKQITVHTIDADLSKNYILSLKSIKYLAKKHQFVNLYNRLDSMINKKDISKEDSYLFIKNVFEELSLASQKYIIYKYVQTIFNGILFKRNLNRDSLMAENIYNLYKIFPKQIFIGQFGNAHIKYVEDGKNMVSLLKNKKQYKVISKEVVSWSYFYCHIHSYSSLRIARNTGKFLEKELHEICDNMNENVSFLDQKKLKKRRVKEKRWNGVIFIKEANEIVTCH